MKKKLPNFKLEESYLKQGLSHIAGVDEAGRGPLAGPVFAAAVILNPTRLGDLKGLDDSKRLNSEQRENYFKLIQDHSLAFSVAWASEGEIDQINILQATFLAMRRALVGLRFSPEMILVDGNRAPDDSLPCKTVVKGDQISLSIAAASVLAKVSRDRVMEVHHGFFPNYQFKKNKGYATAEHLQALEKFGPCPIHRNSFLNKQLELIYLENEE